MSAPLKTRLLDDVKQAMRSGDKSRLTTLRMTTAAIKQREVDERVELQDADIIAVVEKMIKQRRDAEQQYRDAGRDELADQEAAEITILEDYLPTQLSDAEIESEIGKVMAELNADGMQAMGQVMGQLKPRLQGRADMGKVSALVRQKLQS